MKKHLRGYACSTELVRKNLWDVYQGLSALEQSLIHLCAVIYEPTTAPVVYSCFRKTRLGNPKSAYFLF